MDTEKTKKIILKLKIYFPGWYISDNSINYYAKFLSKYPERYIISGSDWVIRNISRANIYISDIITGAKKTGLSQNWKEIEKLNISKEDKNG